MVAQVTQTPLRTIRQLALSSVQWTRQDSDMVLYLQQAGTDTSKRLVRKFKIGASEADIEEKIVKGNFGVFVHVLSDGYPSGAEFLSPPARRSLVTIPECMVTR